MFSFPEHLAKVILDLWPSYVQGPEYDRPSLPEEEQLRLILEVAYLASLEVEESRPIRFTLCCTPPVRSVRRHNTDMAIDSVQFPRRPWTVAEIRRLANAADPDTTCLWINVGKEVPDITIAGLCFLGSEWMLAAQGLSYRHAPLPSALLIRASGPGHLTVYQGSYRLAELRRGEVKTVSADPAESIRGIEDLLEDGLSVMRSRIVPPEHEAPKDWLGFEWSAYINTWISITNSIKYLGHGGTLVVLPSEAYFVEDKTTRLKGSMKKRLRLKYQTSDGGDLLRERFLRFLNSRNRLADLLESADQENVVLTNPYLLTDRELQDANSELSDSCRMIGRLAGVDGAIVMANDLSLIGFGAEATLQKRLSLRVRTVKGIVIPKLDAAVDIESFGMRHRSAARLCNSSPGVAVFVISQDGDVSLMWKMGDTVALRRNIHLANVNMPGA